MNNCQKRRNELIEAIETGIHPKGGLTPLIEEDYQEEAKRRIDHILNTVKPNEHF